MKKLLITIMAILVCDTVFAAPGDGEIVNISEAGNVGQNWIRFIVHNEGHWGDYESARVVQVSEFKRGRRCLGYICFVRPAGCIVVSRIKQLAPIKYYSENQELDPESEDGMADLVKDSMEAALEWMEKIPASDEVVVYQKGWEIRPDRYKKLWAELTKEPEVFQDNLESGIIPMNYEGGDPCLLSTWWHQEEPYNAQCPDMGCSRDCGSNTNAVVGCPSTAGSQVMKYWGWPPYGVDGNYADPYDWANMPDEFFGCTWNQVEVDAVAELCYEVGVAFNSSYGCDITGGGASFLDVLPHFRYSNTAVVRIKSNWNLEQWHAMIKADLDKNRPVYYGIPRHQIVIDGWQEVEPGPVREYHINYGWDNKKNSGWFEIGEIPGGDPCNEGMVNEVYPDVALGEVLSGTYFLQSFPYRYFDQDATGSAAIFMSGQKLQFLHNIVVKSSGLPASYVKFYGSGSDNTILFSRGDTSKGIRIYEGAIKLSSNGGIKFY